MWSILNFFKKKQQPKTQDVCRLSFSLQDNDEVYIECNWFYDDIDTARKLGKLIYLVSAGNFNIKLIKMLEEKGTTDLKENEFIKELLLTWQEYHNLIDQYEHEKLVVNPTDFINNAKK